ncbi:serine protease family S09X [Thraustotheca clavata]|uniref:Serine protease family S09X n=1 Tax=Thraustotheca clavata TaxID=74557 RepID=A0A1V9YVA1_9STRA|nr:serine protease family S09X [Thraustotheca clavata]
MGTTSSSCQLFQEGELEAEFNKRGGSGDLELKKAVQSGFNQMINYLLQPPRRLYTLSDLGSSPLQLSELSIPRLDFQIPFYSKASEGMINLQLYHWELSPDAPIVMYLHANIGSSINSLEIRNECLTAGFSFIAFDFGGAGLSTGKYITGGYEEVKQLEAVISTLDSKRKVFLWGHSLGAATALEFTSVSTRNISGLVLDSPYTSLVDMISSGFENANTNLPRMVFWMTMAMAKNTIHSRAHFSIDKVNPLAASKKCTNSAIFFNGLHDKYVPPSMVSKFESKYNGQATFIPFDGDHYSERPKQLISTGIAFLKQIA